MNDADRTSTCRVRITKAHSPLSWYAGHTDYEFDVRDFSAELFEVTQAEQTDHGRRYRQIRKADAETVYVWGED